MISAWPEYQEEWNDSRAEAEIGLARNLIRGIRNVRSEMNVAPSRKAKVYLVADDEETVKVLEALYEVYFHLMFVSDIEIKTDKSGIEENAVSVVIDKVTIYMPLSDLIDFEKEKERLEKEKKRLEGELKRVRGMLGNEKFMSKAPEKKIAEEREKLAKYEGMMSKVEEELAALEK